MFSRDDEMNPLAESVLELTGDEGGTWLVTTARTHYVLDLDAMRIERIPGPMSSPSVNDRPRRLREIRACSVGDSGCWTMLPDGGTLDPVEYYWQVSTHIQSIQRITTL